MQNLEANEGKGNGVDFEAAIARFRDPTYLPSYEEVCSAFPTDVLIKDMWWLRFVGDSYYGKPGNFLFFEFLTQEYVDALAAYLKSRATDLGANLQEPLKVLEVGAGDGRLAHFMKEQLQSDRSIVYSATDSGTEKWKFTSAFPGVQRLDYRLAVQAYKPAIVISSWMPMGDDWTPVFRRAKSVQEYILIGDEDLCGDPFSTWGNEGPDGIPAPYSVDGFTKHIIRSAEKFQISKGSWYPVTPHSSTISYRRTPQTGV